MSGAERPSLVVAVCTYKRNEPLAVLLEALVTNAKALAGRASVGVVVVDDTAEGQARPVAERFADRFDLGVTYRVSGRQNIALARNMSLEAALQRADWVAITDDDCEPSPGWLGELLETQRRTRADAVSGPLRRRAPPGAPRWLEEEPFLDLAVLDGIEDDARIPSGATHNSMVSARWLRDHPRVRFDPDFGLTGGEDPVFFRSAHAAGMRIHYARRAVVYENLPPSRATLGYQLRTFFWIGNSTYITGLRAGMSHPAHMWLHGGMVLLRALLRPARRLLRGERPQLRYGLAEALRGMGIMTAPMGFRVRHQ